MVGRSSNPIMPKTLQTKQAEANARTLARRKLTAKQQLAVLDKRPGNAKRERARLAA